MVLFVATVLSLSIITPIHQASALQTQNINNTVIGTGNNQFSYSGSWGSGGNTGSYNNDNHYTLSPTAYYTVKFTGTQIKVYSERSVAMGISAYSVDSGTETLVDQYSSTTAKNSLVYTSAAYPYGTHTLKVRNTGTKNSSATKATAVADRVEVIDTTPSNPPEYFGSLITVSGQAATESNAGVKAAMLELKWNMIEPTDNGFTTQSSKDYIATKLQAYRKLKAAGMEVTLGLGMHFTPSWVFNLSNSRYVDQNNTQSTELNMVFNQNVRDKAEDYIRYVDQAFADDGGLAGFWGVRLTSGGDQEMIYSTNRGKFYAYDVNAQNGANKPSTMAPNPMPGWKPGNTTWNGSPVTNAAVSNWLEWYIGALNNVTKWQMDLIDSLGFTGYYQPVTPGTGVRPQALQSDINSLLANNSYSGTGSVWQLYYDAYRNDPRVMVYVSSVGTTSGGSATTCQSGDKQLSITSSANYSTFDTWNAARWQAKIANSYGLTIGGENPGYSSGSTYYTDTSANGLMATSIKQASDCGFTVFYWAHSTSLWPPTGGGSAIIPFSVYANYMNQYNHDGSSPKPQWP